MAWSRDGLGLPGDVRDTPVNVPHPPIPATWKMLSSSETCGVGRSCKMESGVATRRWAATCATLTSRCLRPSHPRPSRRNQREIRVSNGADKPVVHVDNRKSPHLMTRHQAERIRKIIVPVQSHAMISSGTSQAGMPFGSLPLAPHARRYPGQSPSPPPACRREQAKSRRPSLSIRCATSATGVWGRHKATIRHYLMSSARSGLLRFQRVTTRRGRGRAGGLRMHDTSRPMTRSVSRESAR